MSFTNFKNVIDVKRLREGDFALEISLTFNVIGTQSTKKTCFIQNGAIKFDSCRSRCNLTFEAN